MKPHLQQFEREVRAKVQKRQDAGEFAAKFDEKYGQLVDRPAMHYQLQRFEELMEQAQQEAEARARDHLLWLIGTPLLRALDRYDNADLINGLAFAEQTGQCVIGMELSELGTRVLDYWWKNDLEDRSNLVMRGISYNQDDIRAELTTLREAAKAIPPSEQSFELKESIAKHAHAAANAFGRINTLYEQLQSQGRSPSIGLYGWYTLLGRQVLRTAAPNSADRALHHGLRLTLLASVHQTAVDVRVDEAARAGHTLNPQRSAGQVARYLDQAWAEGVMQAHSSDFYKVRASAVILLLEGMLMALKAQQLPDSDTRTKTELFAMAMTTAAAAFEMGASYVDQVVARYGRNSVTGNGALVALGRLKLWGAGLAGVGGLVLSWWDFEDAYQKDLENTEAFTERAKQRTRALAIAYRTRAIATVTLSLAEIGSAIAIAKPLFDYLAHKNSRFVRFLGQTMGKLAQKLGTQVARLLLARLVLGAFWIGLVLTVVIFILEDDALEKWCKRSCYRLSKSLKPYEDDEELAELYLALGEVV